MVVLLGIGFLAGIITAISPCVLPVLPVIVAGSASGGKRRPYAVIAGLVTTFTVSILAATWLLDLLGLPQDVLRKIGIAMLFLLAATLLVPQLGALLERPFAALTRRSGRDLGSGFLLGASLGLVFVPCAGPVLGAVVTAGATHHVTADTVFLALAYAIGAAVPMLVFALAGQRAAQRARVVREHALALRRGIGVLIAATAFAIAFNLDSNFQTALPGYTNALQGKIENTAFATNQLAKLQPAQRRAFEEGADSVGNYGAAPDFTGIETWLNTPGGRALSLGGLHGKVTLVDFWTYSCINCLRTLPHLETWYDRYHRAGFEIVGVHTPEFAFEHVPSNVRSAVDRLGVRYPVALDNRYATWNAYMNRYWPAEYLVDAAGNVRYAHFGEGEYDHTEGAIRRLLAEAGRSLPPPVGMPDTTPLEERTPETYLGDQRASRYANPTLVTDRFARYSIPRKLGRDQFAYGGRWRVDAERAIAGAGARLRFSVTAQKVFLVLGGKGRVDVRFNGSAVKTVRVRQYKLYTLLSLPAAQTGELDLRFSRGVAAYAFTFG